MKWFVGAGLLLLFAMIFQLELLAYSMYALLAVLLTSRLLAQSWIGKISAQRSCSRLKGTVGDLVAVEVAVRNTGSLPIPWVLLEDLLPRRALMFKPPSLEIAGQRMRLAMIWGNTTQFVRYQIKCNRRGYYQLGPLVMETGDLFGLHRRWRVATEPEFLMVVPKVVPLEGFDIASKRPIGEVQMSYRLYEDPTRIAGVRRYEAGDPMNRVNWRATARTGVLHSKVYEPSTVAGATILLDFHQQSHQQRHEPVRSELAVTAAASIANTLYEMGQQLGLITNGRDAADRIRTEGWDFDMRSRKQARRSASMQEDSDRLRPVCVPTRRGADQIVQILETLARIELTDGLSLSELIVETTDRMPRDATVIAILPRVTTETAIALGDLKNQGYAVTAIINTFEGYDYADNAGPLVGYGIDTHHLEDEQRITTICRRFLLR